MKPAALERAIETGRAPVLKAISERGTYVDGCAAMFPSVTPVCATAIATGVRQDEHHIPAMCWYDREEGRYVDYGSSFASSRRLGFSRQLKDLIYNMNGEHLPEYAALLNAEGLLGHQHGNSGWGTFDDDNMVGATAFMETLELALELRRADYGADGEWLGLDLYPYTEDQVAAVARSVHQWRFIDSIAAKIDEGALRAAQATKDAVKAYEIVYAALGAPSPDAR